MSGMGSLDWQDIATAPTDWTVFMVTWRHGGWEGGWAFDFWSGKYLAEMRERIAKGYAKNAPHLYWMPSHWAPLPAGPQVHP